VNGAYGEGEEQEQAAPLIPTAGVNTKIVHPAQDISLVSPGIPLAARQKNRVVDPD
jgi:hypothetical protein